MKTRTIGWFVAMMSVALLTSCEGTTPEEQDYILETVDKTVDITSNAKLIQLTKSQEKVMAANREFSLNVFNRLCKKDENTLISPLSLTMAVSMLANGAEGETLQEILNTLSNSYEKLDIEKLNDNCGIITSRLTNVDSKVKMSLANSLWTDTEFPLLESYKETLSSKFSAEAYSVELDSEEAKEAINNWCSNGTDGQIPEFLKKPLNGCMALINLLNFDAPWRYCFTGYNEKCDFTNYDGSVSTVGMMYDRDDFRYVETNGVKAIELPYSSGAFAMKVIMPESEAFVLDAGSLFTIDKALYEGDKTLMDLKFPTFELHGDMMLQDILKDMGMTRVFGENAQLGKISPVRGLFVNLVQQETVLATDMDGTQAAAVTLATMIGSSGIEPAVPPVPLTIDRPFYFIIEENSSGQILFIGHISKL